MELSDKEIFKMVNYLMQESFAKFTVNSALCDDNISLQSGKTALKNLLDATYYDGAHTSLTTVMMLLVNDEPTVSQIRKILSDQEKVAKEKSLQTFMDFISDSVRFTTNGPIHKSVHLDLSINVGDEVYLNDSSALTTMDGTPVEWLYKCNGHSAPINQLKATVKEIHQCYTTSSNATPSKEYVQDIVVDLEGVLYRTTSKMVTKSYS